MPAAKRRQLVVDLGDELQRRPGFRLDGLEGAPGGMRLALQLVELDEWRPPLYHGLAAAATAFLTVVWMTSLSVADRFDLKSKVAVAGEASVFSDSL